MKQLGVGAGCVIADAGRTVVVHVARAGASGGGHTAIAEDLTAHVIAVAGGETGLCRGEGAVVEAEGDDGGVEETGFTRVGADEGVCVGGDLDNLGSGVEPAQSVEVVDEGLQEDRPLRGFVGIPAIGAGIAGQGPQQLRRSNAAVVDGGAGRCEAGCEAAVETDLEHDSGPPGRSDALIGLNEIGGDGFLREDVLAGCGSFDDEVSMESSRSRYHDRVDVGVREYTRGIGLGACAEAFGQDSRRVDTRIDNGGEMGGVNIMGDGGGVVGTDPTGTDEGQAGG